MHALNFDAIEQSWGELLAMARKSPAGWLILVLVLALPGLIFYFGWVRVREKRASRSISVPPSLGQVFNSAPPGTRVLNSRPAKSMAPVIPTDKFSATAKALPAPVPHPVTSPQAATHVKTPLSEPRDLANAGKPVLKTPPVLAAKPVSVESPKLTVPQLKRDPTLSPTDRKEIYDMLHPRPKPRVVHRRFKKKRGPPIETLIDLEGIIFVSPANAKAIINGNIMKVGGLVHGAKIIKIEKQKVVFSYHGRRVIKVMSNKL